MHLGRIVAPDLGPQAGDNTYIIPRFLCKSLVILREPVRTTLATVICHSGQPRVAIAQLKLAQIVRRPLHRLGGIVGIRQATQLRRCGHELRDALRAHRA